MRTPHVAASCALALLSSWLCAGLARADGAFPDSLQLSAPPGGRLVLATTFGLLVSDPQTSQWHWSCEAVTGTNAFLYQTGPSGMIYAVSYDGLKTGAMEGCGFTEAGGTLASASVQDVFPDPTNAMRVLALARRQLPDRTYAAPAVFESQDGGRTFGAALYQAQESEGLTGVEVAQSDSQTVYVTGVAGGASLRPFLLSSHDSGKTWSRHEAEATLGQRYIRLAAVDPVEPRRLYLRVIDFSTAAPDVLAISDDGGETFRTPLGEDGAPLVLEGPMTAFLRRADGSLLVGVGSAQATRPLLSSRDGGHTFQAIPGAPHVRALAERDGLLFVAADNFTDGYAVGRSGDGGATWHQVLRYDQLCGPAPCADVAAACAAQWESVRVTVGIASNACGTGNPDAGSTPPGPGQGCHCEQPGGPVLFGGLGLLVFYVFRPRRPSGAAGT